MIRLALRLAWRELRAGAAGLRIVLACLTLGVAAIAAVGSLRAGVAQGLAENGRAMLGGDLEVQGGAQPLPDALRDWARAQGARLSDVAELRSMLVAENGERQLVDLKAVDAAYPLVGAVGLAAGSWPQALAPQAGLPGLVTEQLVLDRLGVRVGDAVRLGAARFRVAGVVTADPDRPLTPLQGPLVLIAGDALPATQLVQPGALMEYRLRLALPPNLSATAATRDLRAQFSAGWRIRNTGDAAPGVGRFIDQTALFMTLVGLTALLVGGIGVATGVRAWLEARSRSIATLRCLGASSRLILLLFMAQVVVLCGLGVLAGVVLGAVLPVLASGMLGAALPVPAQAGLYPAPLALAATYGLLTTIVFALAPLGQAARLSGAALFREAALPSRPGRAVLAVNAAAGLALAGLIVAAAPQRRFALGFCAAAAGTLLLFRLGAAGLRWLALRWAHWGGPAIRLGLGNLHRPGTATGVLMVAVGLGLSTLAAVANIEFNIRTELRDQIPADAPSFYFIDLQPDQLPRFNALLAAFSSVRDVRAVPNLRARLVAVNGVPADQVRATPDTRWALRGDRGLTFAATPPQGTHLVAGQWWPADYNGPPLVSFDAGLARGWGLGVGDTIRVNILGRDIDLRIASLRDIAWRTLGLNFAMVASPGLLDRAPHGSIATIRSNPAQDGAILRTITDALPNVTGIRVADLLAQVAALVGRIGTALAATGLLTLASGGLVLAGAVAAGQRQRIRDAAVLRAAGATAAQLRAAWLVEFGAVGLVAGALAGAVGLLAGWAVMRFVLDAPWHPLFGVLAATLGVCLALMLASGLVAAGRALRVRPSTLLRNE